MGTITRSDVAERAGVSRETVRYSECPILEAMKSETAFQQLA